MFICMCIGALVAGFMDIHIVATGKDIMLYHIGGSMIFIIFAIGILIELNIFHVREHFPLVQGQNIGKHIIFLLILCFISFIPFVICYGLTSADFKNAMMQYSEERRITQEGNLEEELIITKREDNSAEKSNGKDDITKEVDKDKTQTADIGNNESTAQTEAVEQEFVEEHDYDGEIFYFEDAVYVVNGAEIKFNSVTFGKMLKPSGYELTFDYSVENTNNADAILKFDSQAGEFRWKDGCTMLIPSVNNKGSNKYADELTIKANQKIENMLCSGQAFL